jgi:hypothetical protein
MYGARLRHSKTKSGSKQYFGGERDGSADADSCSQRISYGHAKSECFTHRNSKTKRFTNGYAECYT